MARVILVLMSTILTFSAYAADGPLGSHTGRLLKCIKTNYKKLVGKNIETPVVRIGPYLRQKFKLSTKSAVVIMDVKVGDNHVLVLSPSSSSSLRSGKTVTEPSELQSFLLTSEEYAAYQADSRKIGSMDMLFESFERIKKHVWVHDGDIKLGSVLKINYKYFVVISEAARQYVEQGHRPETTKVYGLAAFNERPTEGATADNQIHWLEIGGYWPQALDGTSVGGISHLGQAVVDVSQRIGQESVTNFSSTIVKWDNQIMSEPNSIEIRLKINLENYVSAQR